jgi:hypothetical protein
MEPDTRSGDLAHGSSPSLHDQGGPIYIGGLDRSGKTTMSAYLTSHPNIAIPPVGSNMWTYFYGQYGNIADPQNLDRCMSAMMCYKHVRILDPDRTRIESEFRQGVPSYARLFSLFLKHYAQRLGKPRWGAQTGLIERYADELFDAYEGLRVVQMIRDPRDRYLASLERWPNGRGRAGGATARWLYSTRLGERHAKRHPDRYLIVRFEDLVQETELTLRTVCHFLGEEFAVDILEMNGMPTLRDRLSASESATGREPLLSADHIGQYRRKLPDPEIAFIQAHAGRLMAAYGYAPDQLDRDLSDRFHYAFVDWPSLYARKTAWRTVEEMQQRFPGIVGRKPGQRMILEPTPDASPPR